MVVLPTWIDDDFYAGKPDPFVAALKLVADSLQARDGGLAGTRWTISEEAAQAVRACIRPETHDENGGTTGAPLLGRYR